MASTTARRIARLLGLLGLWTSYAWPQSQPLTGTAQIEFSIVDRGAATLTTDGSGVNVGVGYATIQAGTSIPAGVAILEFRINGTLVSEVGVPVSPVIQTGRIYAEVSGSVNTGVAIANPSNKPATLSFSFTNSAGTDFAEGSVLIPPYGQISKFLDQEPFNGGGNIQGTFSFISDVPVSAIALRGLLNERGDFLMSSLPVIDTSSGIGQTPVTLAHFADAEGWTTRIILVNRADTTVSGTIRFLGTSGQALNTIPYSIPRRSSFKYTTPGTGASVQSGSVQITPGGGSETPAAVAIFSYQPAGVTISEAAIVSVSGKTLRMYSEGFGEPGSSGARQSGVAVANLSSTPATVTLEQTRLDGTLLASATVNVPGNGQFAKLLNDIFGPELSVPFQGVLRLTTSGSAISVTGLRGRYNERREFLITTTPPTDETVSVPLPSQPYIFPEVANGGGYSTQFLLFSGSAGQLASGKMRFTNQDGTMPLRLNCPVLSAGMTANPEIIRRVEPEYTEAARLARITGTVIMRAVIPEDGVILITGFIQTLGYGLDENARSALEQWRFCPATVNGRPFALNITVEVNFNLR